MPDVAFRLGRGQDPFIADLVREFQAAPRGVVGIGDDAAVLPGRPTRVVTTDLLVEGQHFRWDLLSASDLAHRALEVNLSDIAAMGARPEAFWLGLAWPRTAMALRRLNRFLAELASLCKQRRIALLGGDTVCGTEGALTIAITAIGQPWPGGPVLRRGAKPGDWIVVSGPLGGAALGLRSLAGQAGRERLAPSARRSAVDRYRRPRARLDLARGLARHASALIDLSDGIGLDLPRLARASRRGFRVEQRAIPLASGAGLDLALHGGDDYELLATIPVHRWRSAQTAAARAGGELWPIGRITQAAGFWLIDSSGRASPWPEKGWDPFKPLDGRRPARVGRFARASGV